ncbi:hypothetical protein D3C84_880530 [compost metagenome]
MRSGFGDGRAIQNGLCAIGNEFFVVEVNPVCRLVLDTFPKRLEFFALKNGLAGADDPAVIRILDVELASELLQNALDVFFCDIRIAPKLSLDIVRQLETAIFQSSTKAVLNLPLSVNKIFALQEFPDFVGLFYTKRCRLSLIVDN